MRERGIIIIYNIEKGGGTLRRILWLLVTINREFSLFRAEQVAYRVREEEEEL